jgi:hypothetical protein
LFPLSYSELGAAFSLDAALSFGSLPHIYVDFASAFAALKRLKSTARCVCVCTGPAARKVGNYEVLPYQAMLQELMEL